MPSLFSGLEAIEEAKRGKQAQILVQGLAGVPTEECRPQFAVKVSRSMGEVQAPGSSGG